MNTRLKIICILFGIIYLIIIGESIVTDLYPSFTAGFKAGYNGSQQTETSKEIDFYAKPINGIYSFPTSIINTKTGEMISAEWNSIHVSLTNPAKLPLWFGITYIFLMISAFFICALVIYIPIQVYKVIRSIVQNEIFDPKNIRRIRRIGYALLIYFSYTAFYIIRSTLEAQALVGLENYKIIFNFKEEYIFLLFGLIVLLFAEILKISHTLKEENDLTV
jgi:hypothetical protein